MQWYIYKDCKLFKVLVSLIDRKKNEDNYFNVNTKYKRSLKFFSLNKMLRTYDFWV